MKPLRDTLNLCAEAGVLLRLAGFEVAFPRMSTATVYYRWPGRPDYLLRVSDHSSKPPSGMKGKIVAKVTFNGTHHAPPGQMNLGDGEVEKLVASAIGHYLMRSRP